MARSTDPEMTTVENSLLYSQTFLIFLRLNITFVRFIHITVCGYNSFIFHCCMVVHRMTVQYFIHYIVDVYLDILNHTILNIPVHIS